MTAKTATILARITPLLPPLLPPSSPSARFPSMMSMPELSMRCWRVLRSPVASRRHSAALSCAARPSGDGGGRESAASMAMRGAGERCRTCVPACTLAASSAARPSRPLALRAKSADWRKGSRIRSAKSGKSTSLGLSVSASSAKTEAMRPRSGSWQEGAAPKEDSRHFSSGLVGSSALPRPPSRLRVSHIVASPVMPARGTFSSVPSTKASAS
mmetsp:Transcript_17610/g.45413  ORF Transcript_17610/g.45413 Transcript_17610/m.45413 type:complete len:214 (-) Transcript_17610:208-849(-)